MSAKMWAVAAAVAVVVMVGVVAVGGQSARQQVPRFEPDPLWSQALPNKWVTGQVGGLAVDSHDNLWVFHRPATIPDGEKAASLNPPQAECCIPAPAVLEFDTNGKFLQAWGGSGRRLRVVAVAARDFRRRQGQRLAERQREGGQPDPEVHRPRASS